MRKYSKKTELIILLLIALFQLLAFYALPKFAKPGDEIGMVLLIILTTFLLSVVFGAVSRSKAKYLYPVATAVLFIPSVFIYYNESALIHSLWYLVVSALGLLIGTLIGKLGRTIIKH